MVDLIKTEEKCLRVIPIIKQREMLSKVDKHINTLKTKIPEKIPVTVKIMENLSINGKLELPLRIRGNMLGVGRHKDRYYTEEELIKSVKVYNDKIMPVKVDHRITETGATVGAVDKLFWDSTNKFIKYEAHINDETHARNILDSVIKEVSVSIFSIRDFDTILGVVGLNLEFSELSLVEDGAFKGNTLEAVL